MNKTLLKLIALFLIITLLCFSLTGCNYTSNIDSLAYVVALGLDIGDTNTLKLTLQFSIPSSASGSDNGSGSSQSSDSVINSIECATIDSGLNIINSYISKKINLAHCKVIVFSEALAYQGISKYVYTLLNDVEVRPDCNIIISKCSSSAFLKNSKPTLEKITARYYDIAPTSSEYTGYTDNLTMNDFFSALNDTFTEPSAILGAVNIPQTHHSQDETKMNYTQDSSYTAGETPLQTPANIENLGLAVFYGDQLVGELNNLETVCHLMITNKLKTCKVTIPSPFQAGSAIDLKLTYNNKTHNDVSFINSSPYITSMIDLNAEILSMTKNSEYLEEENLKRIEQEANHYLEAHISEYLYKTSKDYHTDIAGFGKYAVSHFSTWNDWTDYNWLNNYRNSFFHVEVKTNIRASHLLVES